MVAHQHSSILTQQEIHLRIVGMLTEHLRAALSEASVLQYTDAYVAHMRGAMDDGFKAFLQAHPKPKTD